MIYAWDLGGTSKMGRLKSNLMIRSNVMVEGQANKYKFVPGDLIIQLFPEWSDNRVIAKHLSPQQIEEYQESLICLLCKKPCIGTCR